MGCVGPRIKIGIKMLLNEDELLVSMSIGRLGRLWCPSLALPVNAYQPCRTWERYSVSEIIIFLKTGSHPVAGLAWTHYVDQDGLKLIEIYLYSWHPSACTTTSDNTFYFIGTYSLIHIDTMVTMWHSFVVSLKSKVLRHLWMSFILFK